MNTAEPMLDSPIKWVGGKSKLRSEIIALLPADAECYCEVFAGAAWVLFGKPSHPVEVINDANGDLVNLWRVLKWRPAELLERVHQHLYSREMFMELRQQKPDGSDEMERAVWLYLLIQMSFGADVSRSQSASFGFRNKSRGDLFLNKSLEQFQPAFERLRGVFVEHSDFEKLISRYDQSNTIFFCDPPYLDTCGYAEAFGFQDHQRLAETLHGIQGRFLLTVNDHPAILDLYSDMRLIEMDEARAKARASEGRKAAPILVIMNYAPPQSDEATGQTSLFDDKGIT
ncbi:MAG TPA: DNA adenine methylase [Bryobacteraceae bacterium]|nr:DNA adenine methylase [Bryobacteraceae bacterium]